MPKIRPADTKVDDLTRDELLWLLKNYWRPSHAVVCEARLHGLREAAARALDTRVKLGAIADALDVKAAEALQHAMAGTAKGTLTARANSARWGAYEDAQADARRARDKARAAYDRYEKTTDAADLVRVHLDQLDRWVR